MAIDNPRFAWVVRASIDELIVPDDQAEIVSSANVDEWTPPAGDRDALKRWGLPIMEEYRFIGNIQRSEHPEIKRGTVSFYMLGLFADCEIGADAHSGVVFAFPLGTGDLKPAFINSSISLLIDTAWRWYWVAPEIRQLEFDIRQYDLLDAFLSCRRRRSRSGCEKRRGVIVERPSS